VDDPLLEDFSKDLQQFMKEHGSTAKIYSEGSVLIIEYPFTFRDWLFGYGSLVMFLPDSDEYNRMIRELGFTKVVLKCGFLKYSWTLNPISSNLSSAESRSGIPNSADVREEVFQEQPAAFTDQVESVLNGGQTDETYREPVTGMVFVKMPAGSFQMGSKSGFFDEKPVHRVTISRPFYLQTTEVTQGQWQAVMGDNPSHFINGDYYPVESVSWNDVQTFLNKLNALDPGKNYRLPTEAEWEYACRAGTTGEQYGELNAIAWYNKNSGRQTHPVGKKQPNAWGLYDMLGNVMEWCADWYDASYYARSPATDPLGSSSGSYRVLRGGSWVNYVDYTRSADRDRNYPGFRYDDYGFRCARD